MLSVWYCPGIGLSVDEKGAEVNKKLRNDNTVKIYNLLNKTSLKDSYKIELEKLANGNMVIITKD